MSLFRRKETSGSRSETISSLTVKTRDGSILNIGGLGLNEMEIQDVKDDPSGDLLPSEKRDRYRALNPHLFNWRTPDKLGKKQYIYTDVLGSTSIAWEKDKVLEWACAIPQPRFVISANEIRTMKENGVNLNTLIETILWYIRQGYPTWKSTAEYSYVPSQVMRWFEILWERKLASMQEEK